MAKVKLENVTKRFPGGSVAVDSINLEIENREFLVLVGPSGCGKSTTLRLIAGLETGTQGDVIIADRVVTNVAPRDRDIAMVFQNYALYPHMSVYRNMSFGLMLRHFGGLLGDGVIGRGLRKIFQPRKAANDGRIISEIDEKVRQTAGRLGIEHLLDRKPHQLSGGERQRVALGRAIVRNPAAFLFDEPLSNLDAKLRQQLRIELKRLHRELNATMIYVTHDQVEAMTLGSRVAVMNEGKILQVGPPLEIYRQPSSLFVAKFIGSLPINLCQGKLVRIENGFRFEGDFSMDWQTEGGFENWPSKQPVTLGIRPEDIRLTETGPLKGKVSDLEQLGESTTIHCELVGSNDESIKSGADSNLVVRVDSDRIFRVGQIVHLELDQNRVIWFDPGTGKNILKE
ncbi:MAG: ATP-binding cassette domain-containing protein [Planctomycetota bacterium]